MNRAAFMVLFVSVFVTIQFLMHFYVFARLASFFGIDKGTGFYITIILLSFLFVAASTFERFVDGIAGKYIYISASTWLGTIFLFFFITLAFDILNLLFRINPVIIGSLVLVVGVLVVCAGLYSGIDFEISRIEVPIHELQHNTSIVQLSDLHLGAVRGKEYAEKIVEATNALKPEAVLITGDLADGSGDFTKEIVEPFNKLDAPAFFVTGNHENYLGVEDVLRVLKHTKIKPLRGEVAVLKSVQIVGFDYPLEGSGEKLADNIKRVKFRKDEPVILMYHAAQELEAAKLAGVDLMITGHVHDGQIFPFNFFVRLMFPYVGGLHEYKTMKLFVSRGAGTWGPPMRIGSKNEINLIKLVKA